MNKLRKCKGKYYYQGHFYDFELGYFHKWGSNYEEFENGAGNYTVAIVELPDGKIIMPVAESVVFLDRLED